MGQGPVRAAVGGDHGELQAVPPALEPGLDGHADERPARPGSPDGEGGAVGLVSPRPDAGQGDALLPHPQAGGDRLP